jgi:glycogen operon protein
VLPELATRLSGSADVFARDRRTPQASVNFVTCHDGLTLQDLVSHARKHNEANREENRDGVDENWSSGWGAEGASGARGIVRARERAKRNLVATLAFSLGVPMLSHGDELSRTQGGNNNAYCQDNALTWLDWALDEEKRELLAFVQRAFALRRANPVFARRRFFDGEAADVTGRRRCLHARRLADPTRHALGMLIAGTAATSAAGQAAQHGEDALLLVETARGQLALPLLQAVASGTRCSRRVGPDTETHRVRLASHSFSWCEAGVREGARRRRPRAAARGTHRPTSLPRCARGRDSVAGGWCARFH